MIDVSGSGYFTGDCREIMRCLPDGCVQTCITSPPYYGLRDYGVDGQLGLEATPALYVEAMVEVFREVRRVLADDGTLWLNLGDSYAGSRSGPQGTTGQFNDREVSHQRIGRMPRGERGFESQTKGAASRNPARRPRPVRGMANTSKGGDPKNPNKGPGSNDAPNRQRMPGLKHKDLIGIPWEVAFALRDDGWYLRSDIVWQKLNSMCESVRDRPTKQHEYIFLLAKSETYYYNHEAIKERCVYGDHPRNGVPDREDDQAPGQAKQSGISHKRRHGTKAVDSEIITPLTVGGELVLEIVDGNFREPRRSGNRARSVRADNGGVQDTDANQAFGVPWEDKDGKRNKRSVWAADAGDDVRPMFERIVASQDGPAAIRELKRMLANKRDVWSVATQPYAEAHFAVMPPALVDPCVLAGSRPGDVVLDPFFGSGTVGQVAEKHGRRWIGIDLNPKYAELQAKRTAQRSLVLP